MKTSKPVSARRNTILGKEALRVERHKSPCEPQATDIHETKKMSRVSPVNIWILLGDP